MKTCLSLALASLLACGHAQAADTSPQDELARWQQVAGSTGNAARGQQFFTARHGQEWACASCHGAVPTGQGQHAVTRKGIAPLAPAFNAERFVDRAKADKWFRRNCNDVVGRECTPAEKADLLAWLVSLSR